MKLIVQKYGGTSVGSIDRIKAVAQKVYSSHRSGVKTVVTLSAMSGETNRLIELASQFHNDPNPRELDALLSTGEQVSISLLCLALQNLGVEAKSYTGSQVRISTDSAFGKARIESIDADRIREDLNSGLVVVVAGWATRT